MRYEIWNFGRTRGFPWKGGVPIEILGGAGIETDDTELAEELGEYPLISVTESKDFSSMAKTALVSIAMKKYRIPGAFTMKKQELITRLEEVESNARERS